MKFSASLYLLMVGLIWADEFPRLPNTESTTEADPPSAEESVKAFSLPERTKVKVWASEPMVQNPIAMAWTWKDVGCGKLHIWESKDTI